MEGLNELALLAVAAAPVVTVLVTNLLLMAAGERGTLRFADLGTVGE